VHRRGIERSIPSLLQASAVVIPSAVFHQQGPNVSADNNPLQGFQDLSVIEGDRYVGNFDQGLRSGEGKYEWQCGDIYEGLWCNDERNGFGILKYQSGNIYRGEWLRGQRSGRGEITFCDGSSFHGQWWNDSFCGIGVYTFADGRCLQGDWADGILIEEHQVDVSLALKPMSLEKQQNIQHSNSGKRLNLVQQQKATEKYRGKSLFDLLFCTTLNHAPMSRSSAFDIQNKNQNLGYLQQLVCDKPNNWVDVGGNLVSSMSDAHSNNMSEASEAASRAQTDNDIFCSLQNENARLVSHNQEMKLHLKKLSQALAATGIDQHTQHDLSDHEMVKVDVSGQESLILDLKKQIQIMTCENDALLNELSHADCETEEHLKSKTLLISLSQQVETVELEVSALKAATMRLRNENADLTTKSRLIEDQNKSFQVALAFRSNLSNQQQN
jgi:hypothetical protein